MYMCAYFTHICNNAVELGSEKRRQSARERINSPKSERVYGISFLMDTKFAYRGPAEAPQMVSKLLEVTHGDVLNLFVALFP